MDAIAIAALNEAYESIVYHIARSSCLSQAEIDNLKDSGSRIARGVREIVWTREKVRAEIVKAMGTLFPVHRPAAERGQPIIVGPVETHSLCPHHLLPIVNTVIVGYVPEGKIIGLSKLPRVVDALAHRAVVQEQYTWDLRDLLTRGWLGDGPVTEGLSSSVAVNVRAVHHCMTCRGVKGRALTETEEISGDFCASTGLAYRMFSRFLERSSE